MTFPNSLLVELDSSAQYKVLRKVHLNILPIFCLIAAFCYIDRTNLAYASMSLTRDLRFTPEVYGLGSGLFFLGYTIFMIPSNILLLRIGAPTWIGIIVTTWGLIATCFTWMRTKYQFYTLRVLLGISEAGAFPGMWYYMYLFYPPEHVMFPLSIMEAAVACANVLSAPIAAALLLLDGIAGFKGWQWLFLLEGLPTICLGILVAIAMPKALSSATFLTNQDKRWLLSQLDTSKKLQHEGDAFSNRQIFLEAISNWKVWYIGMVGCLKNMAYNGILFWCPIIVGDLLNKLNLESAGAAEFLPALTSQQLRSRDSWAALLTSIPFLLAATFSLWLGARSPKPHEKHMYLAFPYFLAGLCLSAFPRVASASSVAGFLVLSLVVASLQGTNTVLNAYVPAVASGPGLSVALALYNCVGNSGSVLGPWFIGVLVKRTGRFDDATRLLGGVMCVAALLAWYTRSWSRPPPRDASSTDNDDISKMLDDPDDF